MARKSLEEIFGKKTSQTTNTTNKSKANLPTNKPKQEVKFQMAEDIPGTKMSKIQVPKKSLDEIFSGSSKQNAQQIYNSYFGSPTQNQPEQTPPEEKKPGIVQSVVQGVTSPFLRVGVTAYKAGKDIKNLAEVGIDYLQGDKAGIKKNLSEMSKKGSVDLGYFGKIKPLGEKGNVMDLVDSFGVGVEFGSWLIGGGATKSAVQTGIKGIGKQGVKNAIKYGAKEGAKVGAVGAFGSSLQKQSDIENKPISQRVGEISLDTAKGAAVGGVIGGITGGVVGAIGKKINRKSEIQSMLKEPRQPAKVIQYKKDPLGSVRVDPVAKNALSVGIDKTDVQFIKNSSRADKAVYRKMFDVAERSSQDKAITERPVEYAGQSILGRVKYLVKSRDTIGKNLSDEIARMPEKPINISNILNEFSSDLKSSGVKIKSEGKLDFRGTRFANTPKIQNQLQLLYNDLRPNEYGASLRTPQRINRIRQRIFDDLKLGKINNELTDTSTAIMEKIRSSLEVPLTKISPEYRRLSINYARLSGNLNRFNKLMGRDFNIGDELANLRAGEVANRMLGNASSKTMGTLKEIEDLASEFGLKSDINTRNLVLFNDFLEDLFGITQTRSLRGQLGKGVGDAEEAISAVNDIATKNVMGLVKKGVNLIRGKTPEAQKEAVRKLIDLLR